MRLTSLQHHILHSLLNGATLKVYRTVDGEKTHRLHFLEGETETVDGTTVKALEELRLIQSNMKFPAATYVLTEKAWQSRQDSS